MGITKLEQLNWTVSLPDEEATAQLAARVARALSAPATLTFSGEIGAGKTTFLRAMLRALGVSSAIKSPTFSLVESYACAQFTVHHFDLYRVQDEMELDYIGFRDYFLPDSVCCIEWPEQAAIERVDVHFALQVQGSGRQLSARALTPEGAKLLSSVSGGV